MIVAGCDSLQNTSTPVVHNCAPGAFVWECSIKPTDCHMALFLEACGVDQQSAISAANSQATYQLKPQAAITGTTCTETQRTSYTPPTILPQGDPTCIVTTDDNTCQVCAKGSCCNQYVACFGDINCLCMVGCLYDGISAATCTSMDNCGSLSPASIAMGSCIAASCSVPCVTMGGMLANTSMCEGAGGGGSTGTSCTPGPNLAGNDCYSDGDCESCYCNTSSMLCE